MFLFYNRFVFCISMVVFGAIGIAAFRLYIWDKIVPILTWKFGDTRQRVNLLLQLAEKKTHGEKFMYIVKRGMFNRIWDVTHKMPQFYVEFDSQLETDEVLLIGNNMCNNLIVKFFYDSRPSMVWYGDICKRFNKIKEKFPRLRYVIAVEGKSQSGDVLTKKIGEVGGKCVWMKDHSNPESIIAELEGIIVDPKLNPDTIMTNQGENI